MILPTTLLRIRVMEDGKRRCNLWVPMFLVWPIVIVLMVALSPVALVVAIVWPKGRQLVLAGPAILGACWAMRGFEVRVRDGRDDVLISCD